MLVEVTSVNKNWGSFPVNGLMTKIKKKKKQFLNIREYKYIYIYIYTHSYSHTKIHTLYVYIRIYRVSWDSSVGMATGLKYRGSFPGRRKRCSLFHSVQISPGGPPSLLYKGYLGLFTQA
jgi:hypothetical protein